MRLKTKMPSRLKGVLFDFDGVLGKTMEDHFKAWKHTFEDFGINIKAQDYYPLEGAKLIEIAETLCKKYNYYANDYKEIVKKKIDYYVYNHHTCELYTGVEDAIELLDQKKILKGIVSASVYIQLIKSAGEKFLNKFNYIVDGNSTKRGKPFPDPYIEGINGLGIKKQECIAVENSPLGIVSAKKAGLYCIAICSTLHSDKLSDADVILGKFDDINDFIRQKTG